MKNYIKKSISKHFISFEEPLKAEEYNNLGETWEDYLDNKWVALSDEQFTFHEQNPTASVEEVWNMELFTPSEESILENAKWQKIVEINRYDQSDNVNSFMLGDQSMWLTVTDRQKLATQITASEAGGRSTMTRWFNGISYTFSISSWKSMLTALELYAGDALNMTESHKAAVEALGTIEEVENYDFTQGYPEKLRFEVS